MPFIYILYWGFEPNCGDMTEIIPAIKNLAYPELYPKDFYLNFTERLIWYERSSVLRILYLVYMIHPFLLFLIWYLIALGFLYGIKNLCQYFGLNALTIILIQLILWFVIPYTSVGENELFYSVLSGSVFAKTLGLWAVVYFLNNKYLNAFLLLGISVWFQSLVGLQLGLILGIILLLLYLKKETLFANLWKSIVLFLILILPCLVLFFISSSSVHEHTNLFQELIEFRIGHHFYIQYTAWYHILFFYLMLLFGLLFWRKENSKVFYFLIIQQLLMIGYVIAQFTSNPSVILQTQWLKTTIWVELFFVLGLFKYSAKFKNFDFKPVYLIGGLILVLIIGAWKFNKRKDFHKDEKQLAEWVKQNTDTASLFIIPPQFNCFKSISERSVWVDYKSVCHQTAYLAPWYDRINLLYGIGLNDRRASVNLMDKANGNYQSMSLNQIKDFCQKFGVHYFVLNISRTSDFESSQIVYKNEAYCIVSCNSVF